MGASPTDEYPTTGTIPLWAEFDAEVVTLERGVARAGQAGSAVGILIALGVGAFVTPAMGYALAVLALASLCWFSIVHALLVRKLAVGALRWANPLFELSLPCVAIVIMAQTQGAGYALGSWVPPLLFAFAIILGILRLKVALPIVLGALAGSAYLAIYFLVLWRAPLAGHIDPALARPAMQVSRALTLLLFGALGALANRALRRMIGQAAKKSRAKDLFGKYRLGDLIASGGMGSVYEAVYCPEGGFERKVAVKRVHPHLAADPTFVQRFREEAELGARLAHPNIVTVLDFGREGETYFFAMEYVRRHGPVEGPQALRVGEPRHPRAHRRLHRPRDRRGARVRPRGRAGGRRQAASRRAPRSQPGQRARLAHGAGEDLRLRCGQGARRSFGARDDARCGKIAYLAPELARGVAFDARVDVFALGLVLWELLV